MRQRRRDEGGVEGQRQRQGQGRGRETGTAATHVISAFCVNKKVNEPAERSSERGTPRGDEKVYVQTDRHAGPQTGSRLVVVEIVELES